MSFIVRVVYTVLRTDSKVVLSANKREAVKMVQINGKYVHESNENLTEFALGVGMSEEFAARAASHSATMEVTQNGDEITVVTTADSKPPTSLTIKLGEEFDDYLISGLSLKSVAKMEGNDIKVECKKGAEMVGTRVFHFCDKGVKITMTSKLTPIVCTRTFKRV